MPQRTIDLRSDTVTLPTLAMRRAMAEAAVGDDVYGEDPTVQRLETLAAQRLGKEAALFVPTGTMGNQIAVMTHTRRGDEIILEAESHIFFYEVGGIALLSGVQARTVAGHRGILDAEAVERAIRPANIHFPRTGLLCLENTHNRGGGTVTPLETMNALAEVAKRYCIPVHLDGARVFNAAIALGIDVRELVAAADSVMFCLSKGLAAPVGSIIAGTRQFIKEARRSRKVLGGGMRQVGVLAAAGLVALEMVDRLAEDHANARLLAELVNQVPGLSCDRQWVQTNIVMVDIDPKVASAPELVARMMDNGVKANATGPSRIRLVTHKDVGRDEISEAVEIIKRLVKR